MINVISKSAYLRATTQVVASGLRPAAAAVTLPKETKVAQPGTPISAHSLGQALARGPLAAVAGPGGMSQPPNPSQRQRLQRPAS